MATVESFVNLTLPDVYGAPIPLVTQVVIDSLKRFIGDTWAVSEGFSYMCGWLDPEGYCTVDLESRCFAGHKIVAVKGFKIDGTEHQLFLHKLTEEGTEFLNTSGGTRYFTIDGDYTLQIYPATLNETYHGELICIPKEGCTEVDDVLYDEWSEGIVALAKARLFRMPNKTWTNLELVRENQIEARRIMGRAMQKISKHRTGNSLSVRPRSFIYG